MIRGTPTKVSLQDRSLDGDFNVNMQMMHKKFHFDIPSGVLLGVDFVVFNFIPSYECTQGVLWSISCFTSVDLYRSRSTSCKYWQLMGWYRWKEFGENLKFKMASRSSFSMNKITILPVEDPMNNLFLKL